MTAHDRERWVVLRRAVADGVVGGPEDGAGADTGETALWEVSVSCDHGELEFEVEVTEFIDLITAITVLGARHAREFRCKCSNLDEAVARRAVTAWREAYGRDPVIPEVFR
jgi:hypothetical protein